VEGKETLGQGKGREMGGSEYRERKELVKIEMEMDFVCKKKLGGGHVIIIISLYLLLLLFLFNYVHACMVYRTNTVLKIFSVLYMFTRLGCCNIPRQFITVLFNPNPLGKQNIMTQ
jgi:hypothetical protein